jgi:predicted permease
MRHLFNDLRFGSRILRGNPGFTAVAVLTLALGIAVNSTVFGWIDSVLLRPIPGASESHRLAVLENVTTDGEFIRMSYPDYRDFRDSLRLVSGMAAGFNTGLRIGEVEGGQEIFGQLVTGNFFQVMGVEPLAGRFFLPEEGADPPAFHPVAVISERLWRNRFGADRAAIGGTLRVNGRPLTIIGVAPPEFQGSMTGVLSDIWAPLTLIHHLNRSTEGMLDNRRTRNQDVFVRLAPGVSLEQARAEAAARGAELQAANPDSNAGLGVVLLPVAEAHSVGAQGLLRRPLLILMAVCGIVLLIVCANVANLLLARATARQKEFGIRLALGAGRGRLAGQLLTETFLLAGAGAALGLLLVPWLAGSLVSLLPPINVPIRFDDGLNVRVLGWTVLVCVGAALAAGMAPLACSLRPDLSRTLKEGGRGERSGGRTHRLRGLLVAVEVALAVVALTGAGLFAKSFYAARGADPGFETERVLVAHFNPANTGHPVERQHQFLERLRERLAAAPGVEATGYADIAPLGFDGGPWQDIEVEGYTPRKGENMKLYRTLAAPGYFAVLGIPLLEGRDFTERDREDAPPVAIVNQAFARRFFGGANPIGRKVRSWGRWHTIVGVARNARYHEPAGTREPYFYASFRQAFSTGLNASVFVRTGGDPRAAASLVRREAASIDPSAEVLYAVPLAEHIGQALYPLKVAATLLTVLAALAVLLAGVGLYSVMAYAVSQRTHEFGVRMALGAQPGTVIGMVLRQGLGLTAAGLAAGIAAALALGRLAGGLLVHVDPADPATFAGAAAFLALVAMLASYVPARRATRADPMASLRCE